MNQKDLNYLKRIVSIFIGLNNIVIDSINDKKYSAYFGFTNIEVNKILKHFKMQDRYEVIKAFYDGYKFGNTNIFCPFDIICLI